MTFNKQEADYKLKELSMTHSFALKMASIITSSVVLSLISLCLFFGSLSSIALVFSIIGIILFATFVFKMSHSYGMAM